MTDKTPLSLEELLREQDLYENPLTEKQRAILEAAERLFAEHGYDATPTARVAKEAGVTERTLFKHFPTKADLFRRVFFPLLLKAFAPHQVKQLQKILHGGFASSQEFFTAFAVDRWKLVSALGGRFKLVVSELVRNDTFRKQFGQIFSEHIWKHLVERYAQYQRDGELRSDVPAEVLARMHAFLIAGQALNKGLLNPGRKWDDQEEARIFADLLWNGIKAR